MNSLDNKRILAESAALMAAGKAIASLLWQHRWLICLNLYLLAPVLLYNVDIRRGSAALDDKVGLWNLAVSVLWLVTFQLLFRRPFCFHVLIAPFHFVVLAELFMIFQFEARLTTSYISILVGNYLETEEFIETF